MYARSFQPPDDQSFFLFGPRGSGKTAWLTQALPAAIYVDLLDSDEQRKFLGDPRALGRRIPALHEGWVVIDEVPRVPEILDEVHRLIETRKLRFVLTGSSARKLRRKGVNLLAGRALTCHMHPLTAYELGSDFDLGRALKWGLLPFACTTRSPGRYLSSYVATYLREEVQQEGITRNLAAFARFLESASFSQGSLLNISEVAREAGVQRKAVEEWFVVLEDLLIGYRLAAFTRRAKRRVTTHPKFYFFDAGVFRAIRPRGPFDSEEEIEGAALETVVLQHLRAVNDYADLGYALHYWRTSNGQEVDFVLYGERGLIAIEVKRSARITSKDLAALRLFREDYPMARAYCLHGGERRSHDDGIELIPVVEALHKIAELLG